MVKVSDKWLMPHRGHQGDGDIAEGMRAQIRQ